MAELVQQSSLRQRRIRTQARQQSLELWERRIFILAYHVSNSYKSQRRTLEGPYSVPITIAAPVTCTKDRHLPREALQYSIRITC